MYGNPPAPLEPDRPSPVGPGYRLDDIGGGSAAGTPAQVPGVSFKDYIYGGPFLIPNPSLDIGQYDTTNGDDSRILAEYLIKYKQYYEFSPTPGMNKNHSDPINSITPTITRTVTKETVSGWEITLDSEKKVDIGAAIGSVSLPANDGQTYSGSSSTSTSLTVEDDMLVASCTAMTMYDQYLTTVAYVLVETFENGWPNNAINLRYETVVSRYFVGTETAWDSNSVVFCKNHAEQSLILHRSATFPSIELNQRAGLFNLVHDRRATISRMQALPTFVGPLSQWSRCARGTVAVRGPLGQWSYAG